MANRNDLKEQWQQRLQSWRESGLNQKQWCEQNNIRQPQFWYWKKKLEEMPAALSHKSKNTPAFVPVALASTPTPREAEPTSLAITLPNGLMVSGIDQSNLSLASQLIGVLT